MSQHKVTVLPAQKSFLVDEDTTLLSALQKAGFYVKSSCGGHATCSDCVIKIPTGVDQVTPPEFEEIKLLGNVFHITQERLSCQTKVLGNVTVDITAHDESADEQQLLNKTRQMKKTKLVKKKEVIAKRVEKQAKQDEEESQKEPKQGGFRRPKAFKSPLRD